MKHNKISRECLYAGIQGYPTWEINRQKYPGEQPIGKLAQLSGYTGII